MTSDRYHAPDSAGGAGPTGPTGHEPPPPGAGIMNKLRWIIPAGRFLLT
jgi:hypothetical protein